MSCERTPSRPEGLLKNITTFSLLIWELDRMSGLVYKAPNDAALLRTNDNTIVGSGMVFLLINLEMYSSSGCWHMTDVRLKTNTDGDVSQSVIGWKSTVRMQQLVFWPHFGHFFLQFDIHYLSNPINRTRCHDFRRSTSFESSPVIFWEMQKSRRIIPALFQTGASLGLIYCSSLLSLPRPLGMSF